MPHPRFSAEQAAFINLVIEAIRAEQIAGKSFRFDMREWVMARTAFSYKESIPAFHSGADCGTAACIGGTAHLLLGIPYDGDKSFDAATEPVRAAFGITLAEANELFFLDNTDLTFSDITPASAIRALEILRDEGVVDWSRTMESAQ